MTLELDLWSLLPLATPTFEVVHIEAVSGRLIEYQEPDGGENGDGTGGGRPDFAVDDLRIENLSVNVEKPGGRTLEFDVPRIEAQPLRSRYALFDIMFRSTVTGDVNGHPVRIVTRATPEGRLTAWDIDRMPISIVAAFVSRAPFTWFDSGTVDIDVRDEWQVGSAVDIDMDWRFLMEDVRIGIPQTLGLRERGLALAAQKLFEARDGRADIAFQLVLNHEQFHAAASRDAEALFKVVLDAFAAAIADEVGRSKDEIKQEIRDAADAARDYLNRRRKEEDR